MARQRLRRERGLTLIELLIVVVVVGILAAIAYPSYRDQVRRSHRADVQAFMLDVALRQQQRFLDARTYAPSLVALGMQVPADVAQHYTVALATLPGPPPSFALTATPIGAQLGDRCAELGLDEAGVRTPAECW